MKDAAKIDKLAKAGKDTRPLCGLTIAVKDNIDVAGYPTEAGTPSLKGTAQMVLGNSSSISERSL